MAIDLTGIQQLVAVFNAFLQAFLPIILIGAFISFVVLLAGGKRLLGKLGFNLALTKAKSPSRAKLRIAKLSMLFMLGILTFSMITPTAGGVAVNGNLSCGTSAIFANTPITLTAYNLDASTAYAIYYDGDVVINWTSSSDPIDMIVTIEATAPTTGNSVDAVLYSGVTTVETLTLFVNEVSDFLPTGFLIAVGIAFMIIGVIVLVVKSIIVKRG